MLPDDTWDTLKMPADMKAVEVEIDAPLNPEDRSSLHDELRDIGYQPRDAKQLSLQHSFLGGFDYKIILWVTKHTSESAERIAKKVAAWGAGRIPRRKEGTGGLVLVLEWPAGPPLAAASTVEEVPKRRRTHSCFDERFALCLARRSEKRRVSTTEALEVPFLLKAHRGRDGQIR